MIKMKLTYKDSWVKFEDCIEGMKELPDKSIDLCLTDPPYGRGFKVQRGINASEDVNKDRLPYDDTRLVEGWFEEARRVSKLLIFSPGNNNIGIYAQKEPFKDFLIHYKPNGHGSTYLTFQNRIEHYLVYGKYWDWDFTHKPFSQNMIDAYIESGFLRTHKFLHPAPKSLKLWKYIIQSLNPSTVLDPFMGSGTTLEACIQLSTPKHPIKCIGFELMEEYRVDMEKRIARSKYYKRPQTLELWGVVE